MRSKRPKLGLSMAENEKMETEQETMDQQTYDAIKEFVKQNEKLKDFLSDDFPSISSLGKEVTVETFEKIFRSAPIVASGALSEWLKANKMQTMQMGLNLTPEVSRFLKVKMQEIPGLKLTSTSSCHLLYGSSGVGKTQTAFFLLRKKRSIIYLINQKVQEGSQAIYQEMQSYIPEKYNDVLSMCGEINVNFDEMENDLGNSRSHLFKFAKILLASKLTLSDDFKLSREEHVNDEDVKKKLAGTILFIDEAMPRLNNEIDTLEMQKSIRRLRVYRYLGRILELHVIIAGTNVSGYEIMKYSLADGSSFSGDGSFTWGTFVYCWLSRSLEEADYELLQGGNSDEFNVVFKNVLSMGRHRIISYFTDPDYQAHNLRQNAQPPKNSKELFTDLKKLGVYLKKRKGITNERSFIWLLGIGLQRDSSAVHFGMPLASEDLISSHFFEPAALMFGSSLFVGTKGNKAEVNSKKRNRKGPLSIEISYSKEDQKTITLLIYLFIHNDQSF